MNEFPFNFRFDGIESNGYIDNLIQYFEQDHGVIHIPIEIKSFGGNLRQLNQPYFDAYIQIMSYLGYLQAKIGYIVYITKSDLKAKTYRV